MKDNTCKKEWTIEVLKEEIVKKCLKKKKQMKIENI